MGLNIPSIHKHFFLLILGIALWPACTTSSSPAISVSRIIDGDTLVANGQKIRLLGVDTPEAKRKDHQPGPECYAQEATDFLRSQLAGQKVRIVTDPQASKYDKYGRLLAWIYVNDRLINLEIVSLGFGFATKNFPHGKKAEMAQGETTAKKARLRIWNACSIDCSRGYCRVLDTKN